MAPARRGPLTACRWGETATALERASEHAERADLPRERLVILTHLANAYFWGPTPVDVATERCNEILESARGHQNVEANVMCYLGGLLAMKGDFDEGRDHVRRGRALFAELGNRYGVATHSVIAGQVELLASDPEAAAGVLRSGYESFEEMGETGVLSSVAAFLAEALLELDHAEEAARFAASRRRRLRTTTPPRRSSRASCARGCSPARRPAGAASCSTGHRTGGEDGFPGSKGKGLGRGREDRRRTVRGRRCREGPRRVRGEGQSGFCGGSAPLERERRGPQRRQPRSGNRLRGGRALGMAGHRREEDVPVERVQTGVGARGDRGRPRHVVQ